MRDTPTLMQLIFGGHVHDWTKWKIIEKGHVGHDKITNGSYILQKRVCKVCGKTQQEIQTVRI